MYKVIYQQNLEKDDFSEFKEIYVQNAALILCNRNNTSKFYLAI